MSSQVEMRGQETVAQAHRPERIDTSGRLLPLNPREGVRTQPQLLTRQEIDSINKKLLTAGQTIETTRQRLYETRFVADSALQELEHERNIRQQCSEAYKEAQAQYGKKVVEVHEMATKCMSLNKELEESQITISNYESAFEKFENTIASGKVQLEEERGQLGIALQKIHNLEKEREDAAQKHWVRINEMIAREALAEQKIAEQRQELEGLVRELQAATNITIDPPNSAEGKLGAKRAAHRARGRASKYHRKCKDVRKLGDEDTIEGFS